MWEPIRFAVLLNVIGYSLAFESGAYILMDRNLTSGKDSFAYLTNELVPSVKNGTIKMDRLLLAFLDPSMDPPTVMKDSDVQRLISASGMLSDPQPGDGNSLKQAITALSANKVDVYFAVGGWGASCLDPALPSDVPQPGCTSNFPMTSNIISWFSQAKLKGDISKIQPTSNYTMVQYTAAYTHVVSSFGAKGMDLDYEEYWFAAETAYLYPTLAQGGELPDGPLTMPYSVIKYAAWLRGISSAAKAVGQSVSIAAPAMGPFNIHDGAGGCSYWCPVTKKNQPDSSVCGRSNKYTYKQVDLEGYIKGNFYDMTNYQSINNKGYHWKYPEELMKDLLQNVHTIAPMTYDLDDGYDGVGGSWCIGKVNGHWSARDPNTAGYHNVDCALSAQVETLVKMWDQEVLAKVTGHKPLLAFGLEAGFPNYPINIDDDEPGGGTDVKDPHFRWNDPFVIFDIPFKDTITQDDMKFFDTIKPKLQKSDSLNVADVHSAFLLVGNSWFQKMQSAGASSFILWSLDNSDYSDHLGPKSWDIQQFNSKQYASFGKDYSKWGYNEDILRIIFTYAASPTDILKAHAIYVQTFNDTSKY